METIVISDAERLNWLRDNLFTSKWNGVVGPECAVYWRIAGDFRHTQQLLNDPSGDLGGNFRAAIDAAMKAKP